MTLAEAREAAANTKQQPRHRLASACRVLAAALEESERLRLDPLRQAVGLLDTPEEP